MAKAVINDGRGDLYEKDSSDKFKDWLKYIINGADIGVMSYRMAMSYLNPNKVPDGRGDDSQRNQAEI